MKEIGIIGSGAMGNGIAQVCASAGCSVLVYDHDPKALERAQTTLYLNIQKLVDKNKLSADKASEIQQLVTYVSDLQQLADRELIIEAIVEDLAIKKSVFATLEEIVSTDCILASNTSSLSITSIAASCRNPERVLGIHFFNPAPLMALVEVIPAVQTCSELIPQVKDWVQNLGKLPVVAKDTPGFIVNRVARPFYGEALRIYDEGIASVALIDEAMRNVGNFRMGPFELMDFIGHDVNFRVTESVFEAFYYDPRYKPSLTQKRLFEAQWFGRKSGRGFYTYTESGEKQVAQEELRTSLQTNPTHELQHTIFNRILCTLINEAADALYLGIATAKDLDLAMTKGVNYPKGLLKWADEIGIDNVKRTMDSLYDWYREDRYRLSPLLRQMANEGKRFYN